MSQTPVSRFSADILELLPHRPPMLLINELVSVDSTLAKARVLIDTETAFFEPGLGVPSWIGLEYMGQTAALIAGYQLKMGLAEPHLGFLLGTRRFVAQCACYCANRWLEISCHEQAIVGDSLANFDCAIRYDGESECLASAKLSVYRQPQSSDKDIL